MYVLFVAKNSICLIENFIHVNAGIKCVCGVGIASGKQSRLYVQPVERLTGKIPISFLRWMLIKHSRRIKKKKQLPNVIDNSVNIHHNNIITTIT